MKPVCPYCQKNLEQLPTRKKKCPHCGKEIYVRQGKLMTDKEANFTDAKGQLLGMGLKGLGNAKNMDDLWRILNESILEFAHKGNLQELGSLYLQMAQICFNEKRYRDCIYNYLLCSHYSSVEAVQSRKEYGGGLVFSELMRIDNYMTTSPVINSLEELGIPSIDTHNLGVLAVNPKLSLDDKITILKEALNGNLARLQALDDSDYVVIKERDYEDDLKVEVTKRKKKAGCLAATVGCIGGVAKVMIMIISAFLKLLLKK